MDNPQILLHHLLQEYLVVRDINFKSIWDAYFKRSVGFGIEKGWGASCPGLFILPPTPPRISERMGNPQILLHQLLQEYLVERDINFISVNLRCLLQTFSRVTYCFTGQTTSWFYSKFQYTTTRSSFCMQTTEMIMSGLVLSLKMSFFHLRRSGRKIIFLGNIVHS